MTRLSPLLLSLVLVQACAPEQEGSAAAAGGQGEPPAVPTEEVPLSAGQVELLDLAFESASAFPLEPHLKNRSRAQEQVALANVALGRLDVAFAQVDNPGNEPDTADTRLEIQTGGLTMWHLPLPRGLNAWVGAGVLVSMLSQELEATGTSGNPVTVFPASTLRMIWCIGMAFSPIKLK